MIQAGKIDLDGNELDVVSVKTQNSAVLLMKAKKGMLGCGYFSVEAANKLGDALAIVSGVKSFDEMMEAKISQASEAALKLGIKEGITGKEALKLML